MLLKGDGLELVGELWLLHMVKPTEKNLRHPSYPNLYESHTAQPAWSWQGKCNLELSTDDQASSFMDFQIHKTCLLPTALVMYNREH